MGGITMKETKKKTTQKVLSMILVVLMLLTSLPLNVFAIAFEKQDLDAPVSSSNYQKHMYELELVEQKIKVGEEALAENSVANKDQLPAGTRFYFVDEEIDLENLDPDLDLDQVFGSYVLDTSIPGSKQVTILVVYSDGSLDLVRTLIIIEEKEMEMLMETPQVEEEADFELPEEEIEIVPYSIISPVEKTHTYIFKNGEETVDTQIVKNGEKLLEPKAPEKEGYKFIGWFIDGEDKPINFADPITVDETKEITVNAKFEQVYYVFFMDGIEEETARVFKTKEGATGVEVDTKDVKLPIGSKKAVTGWYKDRVLTDGPVGDKFTVGNSDQKLWPKIEEGNFISFITGENASYIEPEFVGPNKVTVRPADPTRPGYEFSHWSTEKDGASEFTFGETLSEDLTLYAVWTAKTDTTYTVIIWKQSVKDKKDASDDKKTYDYAESYVRTASSGERVSPTSADIGKNYPGFHYNAGKSDTQATVEGNGTTKLNVYYDRNLMTINFYQGTGYYKRFLYEITGLYGQTLAQNDHKWPSDRSWEEIDG